MTRTDALAIALVALLTGCAGQPIVPSVAPSITALECGGVEAALCAEVAEAASLMTGTHPLRVDGLALQGDGGMEMTERYLVRLRDTGDAASAEQLVEVVRFEGSENWSVRRLEAEPTK